MNLTFIEVFSLYSWMLLIQGRCFFREWVWLLSKRVYFSTGFAMSMRIIHEMCHLFQSGVLTKIYINLWGMILFILVMLWVFTFTVRFLVFFMWNFELGGLTSFKSIFGFDMLKCLELSTHYWSFGGLKFYFSIMMNHCLFFFFLICVKSNCFVSKN